MIIIMTGMTMTMMVVMITQSTDHTVFANISIEFNSILVHPPYESVPVDKKDCGGCCKGAEVLGGKVVGHLAIIKMMKMTMMLMMIKMMMIRVKMMLIRVIMMIK